MTEQIILLGWLGPSLILYFCGQVRFFSSVFLWPAYTFFLLAAALTAFITEGGMEGLRKFGNHITGRGFQ